ncbi:phasin family protein [Methylobacterium nigriterrae]|uniref:phasin family protein n=1 Tax=Methylobacterium nigriterrae TaxID=3127512 RepID=UPI003013D2F4
MSSVQNDTQSKAQNKVAGQGGRIAQAAEDDLNKAADLGMKGLDQIAELREQVTENAKQIVTTSVEVASTRARRASDEIARTFGFSGEDGERLARQSKQNMEAVARCGTVLTQALQDASRGWVEIGQKQWRRNLDGLNRLARVRSLQDLAAVQSDLVREGLQSMVQDSRRIAEGSLRAVDEAAKTIAAVPDGRA